MNILRRLRVWLLVRFNLWLDEQRQADAGHEMPDNSKPRERWVRRWRDDGKE